jgi:hypothetical protein
LTLVAIHLTVVHRHTSEIHASINYDDNVSIGTRYEMYKSFGVSSHGNVTENSASAQQSLSELRFDWHSQIELRMFTELNQRIVSHDTQNNGIISNNCVMETKMNE